MKFKYLLLSSLLLSCFIATSQELKNKFGEVYYTSDLYKKENILAEGSPYLDEAFWPAKVNDIAETKLVRFDAMHHRVEILVRKNSVMILDDSQPFTITLLDSSGKVYVNREYRDESGEMRKSFFLRISETDEFGLFEREEIKFYKAVKAQGYKERQPPQYKKEQSTYYLLDKKDGGNFLVELPSRPKKFVALFPKRSKELKDFIKEEKLDLNKGEDLVKALMYYFGSQ